MPDFNIQRLAAIKILISVAFIAGCLISPKLWIEHGQAFPMIKPYEGVPTLKHPYDLLLLAFFVGLLLAWFWIPKLIVGIAFFIAAGTLLLQDQMRWQPWVYLYLLLLFPFLFHNATNEKLILRCLQLAIPGVYVWSGVHKLNPEFLNFLDMQLDGNLSVKNFSGIWSNAGYLPAFIEIALGLALLIPAVRKPGVYAAAIMHLIIIIYLCWFTDRHNTVIIPWNMAMIVLVFLLFGKKDQIEVFSLKKFLIFKPAIIPLVLVWLMPLFNLLGYWDHFLSFSFYSGKPAQFYIAVADGAFAKIDPGVRQHVVAVPGLEGGQIIDADKWALSALNVPLYPETRVFRKLSLHFCRLNIPPGELVFVEATHSRGNQQLQSFTCAP